MGMIFVLTLLLPVLSTDLNDLLRYTGPCFVLFPYLSPNEVFNLYKLNSTAKTRIMKTFRLFSKILLGDKIRNLRMHLFSGKKFNFVVPNFESNSIAIFSFYPKFKVFSVGRGFSKRKVSFFDRKGLIRDYDFTDCKRTPALKFFHRSNCGLLAYVYVEDRLSVVLNGSICKTFSVGRLCSVSKQYKDSILLQSFTGGQISYVLCEFCNVEFAMKIFCIYFFDSSPPVFRKMRECIQEEGENTSNFFKLIRKFPKHHTFSTSFKFK